MNAIIALRCLGYSLDDPQVIRAMDEFEKLGIEEEDTFRMQPCMSPVWDTAYALFALGEAGVPANDPRMVKCADWILQKQVRNVGDWKVKNKKGQPGGWYFEFNNEFYPDVDDSAMVCLALSRVEHPNGRYQRESVQRAIDWIFSMQCKNGGWASFDKDNDKMVFQYIPFADHNAMLDPATVDITGRILEMLATYGYSKDHPAVKKAIQFIRKEQEPDGSWFGRWGVNYIYGTALVLRGLEAIGMDLHEPCIQQGAEWLRMVQNADGGWGETVGSYDDPNLRGQGDSTPSQTAWAILGIARGRRYSQRFGRARHCLPDADAEKRRIVGREVFHRHRIPARVLSEVSPVPAILPAAGADDLREGDGEERRLSLCSGGRLRPLLEHT